MGIGLSLGTFYAATERCVAVWSSNSDGLARIEETFITNFRRAISNNCSAILTLLST